MCSRRMLVCISKVVRWYGGWVVQETTDLRLVVMTWW